MKMSPAEIQQIKEEIICGLSTWSDESIQEAIQDIEDEVLKRRVEIYLTDYLMQIQIATTSIDWSKVNEKPPTMWWEGTDGWNLVSQGDISGLEDYVDEFTKWASRFYKD